MNVIDFRIGRAKVIARQWAEKAAAASGLTGEDRRAYICEWVQYFTEAEREEQARAKRKRRLRK